MDNMELIMTRKSVRTFDGRPLTNEDREKLRMFIATIKNPYDIPVDFVLLDAKQHGLSSPGIQGEHLYIAGKVPKVEHCEEAFGFSFEQMVLYAWSLGIGTTWIGGTMKRELFEAAAELKENELMPIVSPLGYPAKEKSEVDMKLRTNVHGDERLSASELFFENDFSTPMQGSDKKLEAVRWTPTAANMQPCRVVKAGNKYHLYEKHMKGYKPGAPWDVQKIDLGIALCHLMRVTGGEFELSDPEIPCDSDTEYIATVAV
ncbi:MAG: nitroreductase [Oscillospiraceae bacterium]|nr:nitroreductase [Oscillospiraceae bacterium]